MLLGTAWSKIFPTSDPLLTDVVPKQVVQLLLRQLTALKGSFSGEGAMDTEAVAAFAAIRQGAKRFRSSHV